MNGRAVDGETGAKGARKLLAAAGRPVELHFLRGADRKVAHKRQKAERQKAAREKISEEGTSPLADRAEALDLAAALHLSAAVDEAARELIFRDAESSRGGIAAPPRGAT